MSDVYFPSLSPWKMLREWPASDTIPCQNHWVCLRNNLLGQNVVNSCIFVFPKWEQHNHHVLIQRWTTVFEGGPTLNQLRVNALCVGSLTRWGQWPDEDRLTDGRQTLGKFNICHAVTNFLRDNHRSLVTLVTVTYHYYIYHWLPWQPEGGGSCPRVVTRSESWHVRWQGVSSSVEGVRKEHNRSRGVRLNMLND